MLKRGKKAELEIRTLLVIILTIIIGIMILFWILTRFSDAFLP